MSKIKRIGICTHGGDCPGLNAVIRAVVKAATSQGWEVYGIPDGTDGFIDIARGKYQISDLRLKEHGYELPGLLHGLDFLQFLSGSILGSASKANPQQAEVAEEIIQGYQALKLDALIAIAGDKSLDLIYDLACQGQWNLIAIPKTINNDIPFTESSVGFDTAVNIATDALYNLTFTAASHERVMVVQLMGRDAGYLTLYAGVAGGADCILIPEITSQLTPKIIEEICQFIARLRQQGRKFALIVIAEAVRNLQGKKEKDIGDYLANCLRDYSAKLCHSGNDEYCELYQLDTRSCVLGHLQRSAIPSSFDRLMATLFGIKAVNLINQNRYNQMVIWKNGNVESISLDKVIPMIKWSHQENHCSNPVDANGFMVKTASSLGIYLGSTQSFLSGGDSSN